jgi:hypothetical protein
VRDKDAHSKAAAHNEEPEQYPGMVRQMRDMLKDTINTVTGPDGDLGGDQTRTKPEATAVIGRTES